MIYLESVLPNGILTEFLSNGEIAKIINDTLFVHGGIREYNIG